MTSDPSLCTVPLYGLKLPSMDTVNRPLSPLVPNRVLPLEGSAKDWQVGGGNGQEDTYYTGSLYTGALASGS